MTSLVPTTSHPVSLEEKILAMSDGTIARKIPDQLRETGLFNEYEIEHVVAWLQDYRNLHRIDVIE